MHVGGGADDFAEGRDFVEVAGIVWNQFLIGEVVAGVALGATGCSEEKLAAEFVFRRPVFTATDAPIVIERMALVMRSRVM